MAAKKTTKSLNSDLDILRDAVKNKPKAGGVPNPMATPEEKSVPQGRPKDPETTKLETTFQEIPRPQNGPVAIITGKNTRKNTKAFTVYLPKDIQERLENECSNVSGTLTGLIQYAIQHLDKLDQTLYINNQKKTGEN